MTGLLVKREVIDPSLSPLSARPGQYTAGTSAWTGIYLGASEQRVGFIQTRTEPEVRDGESGVATSVSGRIKATIFSTAVEIAATGHAWAPYATGLKSFEFRIQSGEHEMKIAATIKEGKLSGAIDTGGEQIPLNFDVSKNIMLSDITGAASMNIPDLKPGREVFVDTFDPMTLAVTKARVRCVGEETITVAGERVQTKLITTETKGMNTRAWVAPNGEVVRAETPLGFRLEKIRPEDAFKEDEGGDASSFLKIMSITPTGKTPARDIGRMVVKLDGLSQIARPPEDDTQKRMDTTYTITRAAEPGDSASPIPPDPALFAHDLESDPFIQTNHAKIQEKSREIVGDVVTPWAKAKRICEWVYANVKKVNVVSVPSALEVLQTAEGDCNEHTVLYAALARAAGVPTRVAIGLVWSETYKAFYYHAWPEVYVDGRWIWMDPTFGQNVADASHIKLLNGNIEKWMQLTTFVGQLKIEVVEVQ